MNDTENEYGGIKMMQNTLGLNWRFFWNNKGYSNTSISHNLTKFDWNWRLTQTEAELFNNDSDEQEFRLRNVNYYRINPSHKLEFGLEAKFLKAEYDYSHQPYNDLLGNPTDEFLMAKTVHSQKYGLFASTTWKPFGQLSLTPGVRMDHFAYNGNTHFSPRFSFSYQLNSRTSLNGAAGIFYQNLPSFLLYQKAAFKGLQDPKSRHYVLGIHHLLTENTRLTVEVYDKKYDHFPINPTQPSLFIIDQPLYQLIRFTPHDQLVDGGKAYSRGVEVMVQKKLAEKFYGMVGGSYFRSRYQGLDGVWRNRIYDNRYTSNIEVGYKPNHKWEFSARWTYAGGVPYTPYDVNASRALRRGVYDRTNINSKRLPAYNCLNLRFDRRFHFSGSNLIFYFSVLNVLDRTNVWHYQWYEMSNEPITTAQFERSPIFGLEFEF